MSSRDLKNIELTNMIIEIFKTGRNVYGTRRIANELRRKGLIISRRRIAKLMAAADLRCKTKLKFKATTDSKHDKPIAPNLLKRQFHVAALNRYWVDDITYIPTTKGWSTADHMKADLAYGSWQPICLG